MTHWLSEFDEIWKAVSIVLTGAFGILGLVTEFKNKHTKQITKWGWISLWGIVASSVFGVTAQVIESRSTAEESLRLAQKADLTLNQIERGISTINDPKITLQMTMDCASERFKEFCRNISLDTDVTHYEQYWPVSAFKAISICFSFFLSEKESDEWLNRKLGDKPRRTYSFGDLDLCTRFVPIDKGDDKPQTFHVLRTTTEVVVSMGNYSPIIQGDGKLRSTLDFAGATLILFSAEDFDGLTPTFVRVDNKDGQSIGVTGPFEKVWTVNGAGERVPAYKYVFPKTFQPSIQ